MTNEELAALDAAATQGEWSIGEHNGAPFPEILTGPYELASFTAGEHADENQANAELAATLVNLYRAGKLVLVPSVEEVALAMCCTTARCEGCSGKGEGGCFDLKLWEREATAVLASMGAKTSV